MNYEPHDINDRFAFAFMSFIYISTADSKLVPMLGNYKSQILIRVDRERELEEVDGELYSTFQISS